MCRIMERHRVTEAQYGMTIRRVDCGSLKGKFEAKNACVSPGEDCVTAVGKSRPMSPWETNTMELLLSSWMRLVRIGSEVK